MATQNFSIEIGNTGQVNDAYDCSLTTTTSTTTTSTTTTSTTSSTTTTTTAAPTYTPEDVAFGLNSTEACSSTSYVRHYSTGAFGLSTSLLYSATSPSLILATAGWYRIDGDAYSYEWDGSQWTGDAVACPALSTTKTTDGTDETKTMEDGTDKTIE